MLSLVRYLCSVKRRTSALRISRAVCCLALLALIGASAGCVEARYTTPVLARRYYGTWENIVPRYLNWWVISASGAVSYGIASESGRCVRSSAIVKAADAFDVTSGNSGRVTLRAVEGGQLLLFQGDRGFALHRRVDASHICRKSDGTYREGAPSAR